MKTRVLVVDDSAFMRRVITDIINEEESFEVIDTARNGKEAVEKVKSLHPDVVTLDVEMPVMDGLDALERIMEECPVPVLMLSSITKEGADATIRSLELGAIDFITKPSSIFKVNTDDVKAELHEKIKIVRKARLRSVRTRPKKTIRPKPESRTIEPKPVLGRATPTGEVKRIIAIGTSTGGPRALQSVIPMLPGDLDASVVVVQHMPAGFTKSLADRMNSMSELNVKEAENNDVLKPGWVYIAPGDFHLRVIQDRNGYRINLGDDPAVTGHRPSVDAMMYSIGDLGTNNIIGVIMTGMGADGAKGLVNIKQMNKAHIIAQDEESCVVFGMPKSAIAEGVVDRVVSLNEISNEILKAMGV